MPVEKLGSLCEKLGPMNPCRMGGKEVQNEALVGEGIGGLYSKGPLHPPFQNKEGMQLGKERGCMVCCGSTLGFGTVGTGFHSQSTTDIEGYCMDAAARSPDGVLDAVSNHGDRSGGGKAVGH